MAISAEFVLYRPVRCAKGGERDRSCSAPSSKASDRPGFRSEAKGRLERNSWFGGRRRGRDARGLHRRKWLQCRCAWVGEVGQRGLLQSAPIRSRAHLAPFSGDSACEIIRASNILQSL